MFSTDRAGNSEVAHGPIGAPNPQEPVVVIPLTDTTSAAAVVALDGEPGLQVLATSTADWLHATIEDAADGTLDVRLEVSSDHVPTGPAVGIVRLSYGNGRPASGLTVATSGG